MSLLLEQYIDLRNRLQIPMAGWRFHIAEEDVYDKTLRALKYGFRLFDLPPEDEIERAFGKALKDSGVDRNDVCIITKLHNKDRGYEATMDACQKTLKRIGIDYTDVFILGWPNPKEFRESYETISTETWKAFEQLYKNGLAHAIGIGNHDEHHMEHILEYAEISPMIHLARLYPGFAYIDSVRDAERHGMQNIACLPHHYESILNSKEIKIFANKYNVSPREICMRYQIDKGCIILCHDLSEEEVSHLDNVLSFTFSEEDFAFLDRMKDYCSDYYQPDTCDF